MECRTASSPSHWLLLAVALSLVGCSALPVIDVDARSSGPVRIEAADGRMLSAGRSKALLNRLGVGTAQSSPFERHLALEQEISGSPLTMGNEKGAGSRERGKGRGSWWELSSPQV